MIAEIFYGDLPFVLNDELEEGAEGELDSLDIEVLAEASGWKASLVEVGYQRKKRVAGYFSMWVESLKRGRLSGRAVEVSVRCIGLSEPGEKRRRTLAVANQVVSIGPIEKTIVAWLEGEKGEDGNQEVDKVKRRVPKLDDEGEPEYKTIFTPSGQFDRWNIKQAILNVQDIYFTTVKPESDVGGTAMAPPDAPTPPPYIWVGYNDDMRAHHPNGWVLEDRQVDEMFRDGVTGLWAVTDSFAYYYPQIPD